MNQTEVKRVRLNTANQFSEFWAMNGPYEYIFEGCSDIDGEGDQFLPSSKWLFSNSITSLCKEFFKWYEYKCQLIWLDPTPEDIKLAGGKEFIDGEWKVHGLPDYFMNVWQRAKPYPNKSLTPKQAELFFFEAFTKQADEYGYYFYTSDDIESEDFQEYLIDWKP